MPDEKKSSLTEAAIFQIILGNTAMQEVVADAISCTSQELKEFLKRKTELPCELIFHTDGGARGNPGISGCGIVLEELQMKKGFFYFLGIQTNNVAEYTALLKALKLASERNVEKVIVYSDSELMCKQITGEYKVKNSQLQQLYQKAMEYVATLKSFKIEHIRRELNKEADCLANMAMDKKRDGEVEFTTAIS